MSLKFARITAITAATLLACGGAIVTGVAGSAGAATSGTLSKFSLDPQGLPGNGDMVGRTSVSSDGRFLAFTSYASNLVPGDTNGKPDVFLLDRSTGHIERVDLTSSGEQATLGSNANGTADTWISMSNDGRYITFTSSSPLVPGTNGNDEVYVRDRVAGTTELITTGNFLSTLSTGDFERSTDSITPDGRFVVFNSQSGIYVRDRSTGTTELASVMDDGLPAANLFQYGDGWGTSTISPDGRYVTFPSGDQLYVRDRQNQRTITVTVTPAGNPSTTTGYDPLTASTIGVTGYHYLVSGNFSDDGRYLTFASSKSDLVPGAASTDAQYGTQDVFVRDLVANTTELISSDPSGQSVGFSDDPWISGNGRYVAFTGKAAALLGLGLQDPNLSLSPGEMPYSNVFVYDRQTHTMQLSSAAPDGSPGIYPAEAGWVNNDDTIVEFSSYSTNLVPNSPTPQCTNFMSQIYPCNQGYITQQTQPPVNQASATVAAVGTVSTGTSVSVTDPLATSVTTPVAGAVTIAEQATTATVPDGFTLAGWQVQLTAPTASASSPLKFVFVLDGSILPAGADATTLQVFRNGTVVGACAGTDATPDPCVLSRETLADGSTRLTVLTSQASLWTFGQHAPYAFTGFFAPVNNLPVWNTVNAGRAIPVKFSLGGYQGLAVLASGYPRSKQIPCDSTSPTDAVEQTVTTPLNPLSYDSTTGQYTYVWKTDKLWSATPGGPCRQLVVKFNDGRSYQANFKLS
jgi:hypothetical protein